MYSGQWTGVFNRSYNTWKVQGQVVSEWRLKVVELLRGRKEGSEGRREGGREGRRKREREGEERWLVSFRSGAV